jgi:hypothetical protein
MYKRYILHPLLCLMILSNFWGANETLAEAERIEPKGVSLLQLIANPGEYHGKLVRVIGFFRLELEGDALYLHRVDFQQGLTKNAVWVDVGQRVSVGGRNLSDRYVLIEGVFNAEDKGHMDLFSGSLKEVKRMEHWRSRKDLQRSGRPASRR